MPLGQAIHEKAIPCRLDHGECTCAAVSDQLLSVRGPAVAFAVGFPVPPLLSIASEIGLARDQPLSRVSIDAHYTLARSLDGHG